MEETRLGRGGTMFHDIEDALDDLKAGKVIIVCDDADRENEGDFVGLAECVTPDMVNFMAKEGRGLICAPVSKRFADKLELKQMVQVNTDHHETAFTVSVDYTDTTTGISAYERALTIRKLLDEASHPSDFRRPGHIFPIVAKQGGVLQRAGHTEATIDLARLANAKEAGVICEVMNDDGTMARVDDLVAIAGKFNLKMITINDLIAYRREHEALVDKEVEVDLPTEFGGFKAIAYTDRMEGKEHVALVKGEVCEEEPVLVRVHSECLTGDVFASNRCDCGPQLHAALSRINHEGKGILLYMRQEGRGIGLVNKLKAYKLQEEGYDTVEANHKLGFEADLRDYDTSAQILQTLGVRKVRLLTNNPRKMAGLSGCNGLEVIERIPLQMPTHKENACYLKTKQEKLGHVLTF